MTRPPDDVSTAQMRMANCPIPGTCWSCLPLPDDDEPLDLHLYSFMRICPDCGDKRCPHIANHEQACTRSTPGPAPDGAQLVRAERVALLPVPAGPAAAVNQGMNPTPADIPITLAWFQPNATPRFEGCPHHCRDSSCKDTNWGGHDRVHSRDEDCPPVKTFTPCPGKCVTDPAPVVEDKAAPDPDQALVGLIAVAMSQPTLPVEGALCHYEAQSRRVVDALRTAGWNSPDEVQTKLIDLAFMYIGDADPTAEQVEGDVKHEITPVIGWLRRYVHDNTTPDQAQLESILARLLRGLEVFDRTRRNV